MTQEDFDAISLAENSFKFSAKTRLLLEGTFTRHLGYFITDDVNVVKL